MTQRKPEIPSASNGSTLPWYGEGLRFKCTGCGKCCTGAPGFVWVDEEEINAIASTLGMNSEEFSNTYVRQVDNKQSLIEKKQTNGENDCIFLKNKACTIYNARPKQCRTYPWWVHNLTSESAWNETAADCEGVNHKDAPLIKAADILKVLNS